MRVLFAITLISVSACIGHASQNTSPIVPFWSELISSQEPPQRQEPSGLIITDILRSSRGPTIFLATDARRPVLLVDPNKSGPGRIVPLSLTGNPVRIAEGAGETLWIGGVKDSRISGFSAPKSEAYLAKLDRQGRVAWEKAFGENSLKSIQGLAPFSSGDVIVVGRHNDKSWLARVSSEGKIIWERFLGLPKSNSVRVVNNRIIVAGFDGGFIGGNAYQDDVVLWTFDDAGQQLDRKVLREGISTERTGYYGDIKVQEAEGSLYVFSAWTDSFSAKPIEISKIDLEGRLVWRKELAETILRRPNSKSFEYCTAGFAVLANGDPLVACALLDTATLIRLDSVTGATTQKAFLLPDCHMNSATALFVRQNSATDIFVFGSRPYDVLRASCTWLGEMSLEEFN